MEFLYSVLLIFAIIVIIAYLLYTQFVVVESETEWVVDRLGKDRVLKEGVNRFIPILDKKEAVVDMREEEIDPPAQEIITRDNIKLQIDVIASIRVVDSLKAVKSVKDYKKAIESAIAASVFSTLGNKNLEEIQKNVDAITKEIKNHTEEESISRWGVKVENVRVENMKPPKSVVDAMEKEIAAEREQRASILKAEGEHKVAELHADSERLLIEKRAEATHKVIKDLKSLMPDISDQNIMEFLTKTSYIDSMRELSSSANSKFVLYPSEVQKPMDKVMSAEYMSKAM
ncbi:MAG: SPFH/Band 7/PHB domain protein, partial [Sulfurovaceae bacterium]|nr:SPFH/Band 7/PHB domain protein [Sulfurovaceae bacterium]